MDYAAYQELKINCVEAGILVMRAEEGKLSVTTARMHFPGPEPKDF